MLGLFFNFLELEIVEAMAEPIEALRPPTPMDVVEDYSDIDCHRILSVAGKV